MIEVPHRLLAWCYANLRSEALASPTCAELRSAIGETLGDERPTDSKSTCNCRRLTYPHYRSMPSGCPMYYPAHENGHAITPSSAQENGSNPAGDQ